MAAKKDNSVIEKIKDVASGIYNKIRKIKAPEIEMPIRALSNVEYSEKEGYFKLLNKKKSRTLTASTIKTFAQTLRMMGLSKELIEKDDIATKREAYYVSKNWGDARFKEQPESLSCDENVLVRIENKIKLLPAKEVVNYAFKKGDIIEENKKVSVEDLELFSLSFDQNLKIKEHRIKYVHKHKSRDLIKIISASGREVSVTPFHSVFTISKKGIIESKSASKINSEDYIAIPKKLSIEVNKNKINLIDFLKKEKLYVYFNEVKEFNKTIKEIPINILNNFVSRNYKNNPKKVVYQWRLHNSIPLSLFSKLNKSTKNILLAFPEGKIKIKPIIKKNYSLGLILGLLLSEGSNYKIIRKREERRVTFSNNSKKIMDSFIKHFKLSFGPKSLNNQPIKDKTGNYKLNVGYVFLSKILERVFDYKAGTKSWNKVVPSLLFDSPDECIEGFIRGFWLGDGSKNYNSYRFHSSSRELIEGINFLLLRKGIFSKIYSYNKRQDHHHDPFELKITNLDSTERLSKIIEKEKKGRVTKSSLSGDRVPNIGILINQVRRSCSKKLPHSTIKMLDWYTMEKNNPSVSLPTLKKIIQSFEKYKPKDPSFALLQRYCGGDIYWDKVKEVKNCLKSEFTMDFTVNPTQNFVGGKGLILLHNSDTVMDDIEAMIGVNRERIGFIPEEKGGAVAGELIVVDKDPDGKKLEIDCTKFGSGAYSVPSSVEHLSFKTKAKFILAIETAGMFERLNKHLYWKKANCILISMGGVPTRACRRFIRKLSDEKKLPVYVFTDGDPYGYFNIYRTLKVGSGNAAHINEFFCVPQAKFLGVTPQDIIDYKLPTHPLKDLDYKKIKDIIKGDPFCRRSKEWQKALQQMAKMKVRVEQQAFSARSLNYVLETYLPEKLKNPKKWLP